MTGADFKSATADDKWKVVHRDVRLPDECGRGKVIASVMQMAGIR